MSGVIFFVSDTHTIVILTKSRRSELRFGVMKMQKRLLSVLITSFIFHTGCQMVVVSHNRLNKANSKTLLQSSSSSESSLALNNIPNKGDNLPSQINEDASRQDPHRIKYHSSYSKNQWMAVEGELENGKRYPLILDTGTSICLFVNDLHVIENKLPIIPLRSSNAQVGWGRCFLPKLKIGDLSLVDWPCFYKEQHTEVQFFGLPLSKDKAIVAGLGALRKFKYIAFDSINEEVELSKEKIFEPTDPLTWLKYPFSIEEDFGGNAFLLVKIPIAGENADIQFDTGSGRGLSLSEDLWHKIQNKYKRIRLSKGKDLYPYMGLLSCKKGVIPELEFGDLIVKNAHVSVFPNDSPVVDQGSGLVGMQYFLDTVVVLDFERNLMWIKS